MCEGKLGASLVDVCFVEGKTEGGEEMGRVSNVSTFQPDVDKTGSTEKRLVKIVHTHLSQNFFVLCYYSVCNQR
jgi:hypothetical protein